MTLGATAPLVALNAVAASIWVGGIVVTFVVAGVAGATLEPGDRVAFFRALGSYGIVGGTALIVALLSSVLLLRNQPWDLLVRWRYFASS